MLLSILAHHSEPGDPELLEWLLHRLDAIVGAGPETMVIVLGLVVVAVPVALMALYFAKLRHQRR